MLSTSDYLSYVDEALDAMARVYQELAQHLGQLELTRDILLRSA